MPLVLSDNGPLRINVRYVHRRKSDGLFFYYRRIPRALKRHYPHAGLFIRKSLGTKDPARAAERAIDHANRDDALWARLRAPDPQGRVAQHRQSQAGATIDLLANLLGQQAVRTDHGGSVHDGGPLLSEVTEDYLRHHRKGHLPEFVKVTRLGIGAVIKTVGDLPLRQYTRQHARATRDALMATGNRTGTVRRRLRTIIAIVNHGVSEHAPDIANVFSKLKIPQEATDIESREPFTSGELRVIAAACKRADDDLRHIVALMLDTGARLSEIVGLRRDNVKLTGGVPHLWIREDLRVGRSLKTPNSTRVVPLVGMALWGAEVALERMSKGQTWVFARYAEDHNVRATHASNTLAKWLRSLTGTRKTSHSLRHSMRDRLRAAGVNQELQDILGGWGTKNVGQTYGVGYPLETLRDAMAKVVFHDTP